MKKRTVKRLGLLSVATIMTMSMAACGTQKEENTGDVQEETTQDTTQETQQEELLNQVAEEDVPQLDGYELLWHDEFNGTTLDETNWTKELREPGWTNNELQEYTENDANIYVQDGILTLKAEKTTDENGNDYYTSGKVNSQNKKDFLYGKVVARAKAPTGKGLWPAIWMMPQDEGHYGQWPKCGEIDIMEVLGDQTNIAYCTLHYGEPHGEQQDFVNLSSNDFADTFHEYSVEWEPGEIRWYIDDKLVLTANDWYSAVQGEDWKPYPAPFDQPFFVQMNLAVGGNWPGNPDANTNFDEAKFEIDYVRVYQKPEYDTNVSRPEIELRDPDENGNYVFNGDFSDAEDLSDEENWQFLLFNGGAGEASIEDGVVTITSTDAGTEDYSVQFLQANVPMKQGNTYRVTFDAKADEARTMITCVSAPNVGWIRYLPDTSLDLTTEWQTYTYEFEMKDNSDATARLEFNMGNQGSTATIYLANVKLEIVE
ncbi:MAG: family 16 glycosylhydrolase [Lachnospiraceae bacterium]|nr:family 16 glycosylhydrolase [Lachnospiraceae bacterium]